MDGIRTYAKYFGGDLRIQGMQGYGSDVYLRINRLGEIKEQHGGRSGVRWSRVNVAADEHT